MEATKLPEGKRLRQLDLGAPLISTRRSYGATEAVKTNHFDTLRVYSFDKPSRRVPFSWEAAPGVPKDDVARPLNSDDDSDLFMPPKPPPGRRPPPKQEVKDDRSVGNNNSNDHGGGDEADNNSDDDDDLFLDALDDLSLAESLGVAPPSFIMDRFLPAAKALATASALSLNAKNSNPKKASSSSSSYSIHHRFHRNQNKSSSKQPSTIGAKPRLAQAPRANARSRSPPKTCGLMLLFPWNLKSTLCGFKTTSPCITQVASKGRSRCSNAGYGYEIDGHVGGCEDDKMSTKACRSPGWGLPFLDNASRLRTRRSGDHMGKAKLEGNPDRGRATCMLPPLSPPS